MTKDNLSRNSIDAHDLKILDEFDTSKKHASPSYTIKIDDDQLSIIGVGSVSIKLIKKYLSAPVFQGFINTIFSIAQFGQLAPITLINNICAFRRFINRMKISHITVETVSEIHGSYTVSQYGLIKNFLKTWHSFGFEGVNEDVVDFLNEMSQPHRRNRPTGSKIRSDNPEEGWYTDQEYNDLVEIVWNDYETGKVNLQSSLILLLGAQYGRRPRQLAQLKILDIKTHGVSCGVTGNRIEFPGAKEIGSNGFREAKQEIHPLGDELWNLCQLQIKKTREVWGKSLGHNLSDEEANELPLFFYSAKLERQKRIAIILDHTNQPEKIYTSHILHLSSGSISKTLARKRGGTIRFGTPIISHRTGNHLIENAYRFRYTSARQLARIGVPRKSLQYWMGHETSKSLEAYYDDPAEQSRVLDEAMTSLLAPLAQAFQGDLIDSEADAIRGSDLSSRIELEGKKSLGVGSCGEHGFCSASVPIPCYCCSRFQPWLYGPHEEVLERLLMRQRMENETPLVGQSRRLLVPIQLDKDIKAVRIVIALCNERKKDIGVVE